MSYYFLEICSEEIPADFVNVGIDHLVSSFEKLLSDSKISYEDILSDGTPRRLFVWIKGLPDKQPDIEEEVMGPPASLAFDTDGNLTTAALNFAKAKGLPIESLRKITTPKGDYLSGKKFIAGKSTREILVEHVPRIIQNIPFKKTMRWGDKNFRFARPVKSFISLFDNEVLPFEIDGIKANNFTFGHRFHSKNEIIVSHPEDYFKKLSEHYVIVERNRRKEKIKSEILSIAQKNNVVVDIDDELLNTVTNLVEYPFVVLGSFSEDFLKLPEEVLITSMKNHQKYFYTKNRNTGRVSNLFIGVSNTRPVNDNIRKGYERVLRARLKDAAFFYENDKNIPLSARVEELKKVIYQEKLGTSYEKMERFRSLAAFLAEELKLDSKQKDFIDKTAYLCKADLMTEMVYEFPELQGVMGREYARVQGEDEEVCTGIYEHYLPRFSGDQIPTTISGTLVSIADKIDTICGCFSIGLIPTGNNDPYALRRNAIGVLQIIRGKGFRLDLLRIIERSLQLLENKVTFDKQSIKSSVIDFILQRFKQLLISDGCDPDAVDAVLELSHDILKLEKMAKALTDAKGSDLFTSVAQSYKRISNILKKAQHTNTIFDSKLFQQSAEKTLFERINGISSDFQLYLEREDFNKSLELLLTLEPYINKFFDDVMVMVDDEVIRNNRLSFLGFLKGYFDKIGNLSLINQ
ncbi:MAG: glycine--tRNA ligase subunit beta [Calditerrivibrio sp.]|nr:glycine--tRNA ligase subunit beta [Calditerrivibrio sp.]